MGDREVKVDKTGIRGLIAAKTALDPFNVIGKLRTILKERPHEFRYTLRVIPVEKVVRTDLDEIRRSVMELGGKIGENETFRVTVEKRFTSIHTREIIEAAAADIRQKVNLARPDKVVLIEVVGGLTGIAVIRLDDMISVVKERA
jgi:tRNA acetyltransferase TAN1